MNVFVIDERKVKALAELRGLSTMRELAQAADIGEATLYNVLAGGGFRSATLESLAKALNVNPIDLLRVEGYPAPHMAAPAIAFA